MTHAGGDRITDDAANGNPYLIFGEPLFPDEHEKGFIISDIGPEFGIPAIRAGSRIVAAAVLLGTTLAAGKFLTDQFRAK